MLDYEQSLARRYRALLEVSESVALHRGLPELFHDLAVRLHLLARFDFLSLILHEPSRSTMRLHVLEGLEPGAPGPGLETHVGDGPAGLVWQTQRPWVHTDIRRETRYPRVLDLLRSHGVLSCCVLPLTTVHRRLGALGFGSRHTFAYPDADLEFLSLVAAQVAVAVDNVLAYRQITDLKDKLNNERLYLEDEIRTAYDCAEIVGESAAMKRVLRDVETVAPTDSSVFISGERGTGKELIARAIHHHSRRRERTFVKLDCSASPAGLLESELFGHEKGAFDGAIARKLGRFELADQGTLFLDGIGDLPFELQPKLLRVLQEREFERVGGSRTIRVDVRLVTATHRDLARMVAAREFRSDLFYRVNVFPIALPPLRERCEDIPLLVRYLTRKFARRMNRPVRTVPGAAMEALMRWPWPGNVRELENFLERAVMLTGDGVLQVPLDGLRHPPGPNGPPPLGTLADAEREHILRALGDTRWKVGGPGGAAALLGMKRTTLQSRMQKLGISMPRTLAKDGQAAEMSLEDRPAPPEQAS